MCERSNQATSALPRDPSFDREVENIKARAYAAQCGAGIDAGSKPAEPCMSTTARELRQRRAELMERVRRLNNKIYVLESILDTFVD